MEKTNSRSLSLFALLIVFSLKSRHGAHAASAIIGVSEAELKTEQQLKELAQLRECFTWLPPSIAEGGQKTKWDEKVFVGLAVAENDDDENIEQGGDTTDAGEDGHAKIVESEHSRTVQLVLKYEKMPQDGQKPAHYLLSDVGVTNEFMAGVPTASAQVNQGLYNRVQELLDKLPPYLQRQEEEQGGESKRNGVYLAFKQGGLQVYRQNEDGRSATMARTMNEMVLARVATSIKANYRMERADGKKFFLFPSAP